MIQNRRCGTIDTYDLLAFVEGELAPDLAAKVTTHLATPCVTCQSEVDFLRTVQKAAMVQTEDPPAPLKAGAYAIPESTPQAQLDYDSQTEPVASGIRSSGLQDRTLRWRIDALQIELTIEPSGKVGDVCQVAGQVFDNDEEPVAGVQLVIDRDTSGQVTSDDLGCFATTARTPRELAFTPPGGNELRLLVPDE
ncbi:MAG: hypothetical protein AAF581_17625 [Planctomycetota bacterium]